MRAAPVRADGSSIRWVEIPGSEPARVYLHGLGSSSAPYYAEAVSRPQLAGAGRRSLLMDLLGFGISDRPADADYTMAEHADHVAAALTAAGVAGAEVVGHSMGGTISAHLAARHPHLASKLVLVDPTLHPVPTTSGILKHDEAGFLACGWEETLERVGPAWAATMRMAGREALYRSALGMAHMEPTAWKLLHDLDIPRTCLRPAHGEAVGGDAELAVSGVRIVPVPDCGHNIMLDNVDGFVAEVAAALA
ncbi:alpha/beta hydrolase [Streptomyces sp. NPDC091267]|uniref:alpha/beta fold hydrolase n=1 Tax=unclassified Streptomyces TaxID=2593676 RepID=UPI003431F872